MRISGGMMCLCRGIGFRHGFSSNDKWRLPVPSTLPSIDGISQRRTCKVRVAQVRFLLVGVLFRGRHVVGEALSSDRLTPRPTGRPGLFVYRCERLSAGIPG